MDLLVLIFCIGIYLFVNRDKLVKTKLMFNVKLKKGSDKDCIVYVHMYKKDVSVETLVPIVLRCLQCEYPNIKENNIPSFIMEQINRAVSDNYAEVEFKTERFYE